MKTKFAAFDIDGTLIRWQLYHAIADALAKLGYFDQETFQLIRQARMDWKQRSSDEAFKSYEIKLVKLFDQALKNITVSQLEGAVDLVFKEYKDQVYIYTRELLKELKRGGYKLFAISNSQSEIIEKIADYYGFDDWVGSIYHRAGSKFTGSKTVYLRDKDRILKQLVGKHNVGWHDSVAVGDSSGDIPMLRLVDRPIAFNPEKKLFETAKSNGWEVVVERKNMVYKLRHSDGKYQLV